MSLTAPQQFPQLQKSSTLAAGLAQSSHPSNFSSLPGVPQVNKNAFVGMDLGVPVSPLEAYTSMDPKDYVWGTPSPQQQQHLFQQFMQMAFFCHLASTANSMVNVNQPQPQLPFLPFPFPPFSHMPGTPFPFSPSMAPMQGFQQLSTSSPPTSAAPCPPNDQTIVPASTLPSTNCESSDSQQNARSTPPTSPTSTASVVAPETKGSPNTALEGCEIDCDVIQRLLDDNDICAGHDNLDQVMNNFEYMGSPSGSDGSTATGETVLGGGIDSPVSVSGEDTFALGVPGNELSLSDEEFDAVMKGMNGFTTHTDFADFDLDEIMTIEERITEKSTPSKTASNASSATQQTADRPNKKSKVPKVQGGVAKVTARAKAGAATALHAIGEFILS